MIKYSKRIINFSSIIIFLISLFLVFQSFIDSHMPDLFYSLRKETICIDTFIPFIKFKIKPKSNFIPASSNGENFYDCDLTLFGLPLKNVRLQITDRKTVIPYGIPFGAKIFTQGIMITDISPVETNNGDAFPANDASLRKGDIITHANQQQINSNEDLFKVVENSNGKVISLDIIRNNLKLKTNIIPVKSVENIFRLGISVKDSSSGIGTITFCNNEKTLFAALGHGIRDIETNEIIPLSHGEIIKANIKNIIKPANETTGELRGFFSGDSSIGTIELNDESGIYGQLNNPINSDFLPIKVAMKQELKKGPAKMISTIEGDIPKVYDINIDKINFDKKSPNKNISITIIDKKLIEKTGGVVQGMSGSPIIQNDMLIGALTHVVSNNPLKGYGIFAETMVNKIN